MSSEPCSWCGTAVEADEGWRAGEHAGERRATFCRLEHVVPWVIQGARWEAGSIVAPDAGSDSCASCQAPLDDGRVILIRHRGEHRISDAFCGPEHMRQWAGAGGRWR